MLIRRAAWASGTATITARMAGTAIAALLVASGCAETATTETSGSEVDGPATTATPPAPNGPGETTVAAAPTTSETTTTGKVDPSYSSEVVLLGPELAAAMTGVSWRPDCPVPLEDLRQLKVTHWNFEGATDVGILIVHRDVADALAGVFEQLFAQRFAIRQMVPVHTFGGTGNPEEGADDYASIEADNTSAFNCRQRTGGGEFSQHSSGTALDLNPLENPYVTAAGTTSHPNSEPFLDRSKDGQGVITSGGGVEAAFAKAGWQWGGNWVGIVDYQHFSVNGR